MNGTMAGCIVALATLMIAPTVMAKQPACTVVSINNNQVALECATTDGIQPKAKVTLNPVGKKSLEGC